MSWSQRLIVLGGAYHLGFAAFHLCFWRLFRWRDELPRLSFLNRQTMQVMNLCLTTFLLAMAWLSFAHTAELPASPLGRSLLAAVSLFWFLRMLEQPLFYGWRTRTSIALTSVFLVGSGLYALPLLLASR